jgi:hypothetical protein
MGTPDGDGQFQEVCIPVLYPDDHYLPPNACYGISKKVLSGQITFTPASERNRTVLGIYKEKLPTVVASSESLLGAAKYMAIDMQLDLRDFFGINTFVETGKNFVRLKMNMMPDEDKNNWERIKNIITTSSKSTSEAQDRINKFGIGRERLKKAFSDKLDIDLATQAATGNETSHALLGAKKDGVAFIDYYFNPFTWRTIDGFRTLITDTCLEHSKGAYRGRAAIAFSATALLVHEMGHAQGCMVLDKRSCEGTSGEAYASADPTAPPPPSEQANATDCDAVLASHPYIGKRVIAGGKPGWYTKVDFTGVNADAPRASLSSETEPDWKPWYLSPNERILRSGKLDAALDPVNVSKEQETMDFAAKNKGKNMRAILDECSKIRDTKGYDRLNEMRAWYTSEVNSEKEKWGPRPRLAMDKILHRDEVPTPEWLIGALDGAKRNNELIEGDYELIKDKYVQQPPPEENGTGTRVPE